MHVHKLEKIWLVFGITMLAVFLIVLGVATFSYGMAPPSHSHAIDPERIDQTPPFDQPGLKQVGENEYEAAMIAYAFGYKPNDLVVPVGATVHFKVTTPDVIHGFAIPNTTVNVMVVPGHVSQISYTFDEPGEYLVLCNEYCGGGHEFMKTVITVQ